MRVCLLTPGLPAPEPVAEYADRLARRHDVVTALTERPPPADVAGTVAVGDAVAGEVFDVAIAMDWAATAHLFAVPARRHVLWVDHFAHRRMGTWQADRFAAQLAYDLPVDFVAAAPWVRDALAELRPDARCVLATIGLPEGAAASRPAAAEGVTPPLRVALAGDGDERAAFAAMDEAAEEVELADGPDVVVMLSTVDGVLGAPLAGFRAGATAVVGPAHDAADLVEHGENGFVADADDLPGAARFLDLLARDRELLTRLKGAALAKGEAWPDWERSTEELEAALEQILAEDPPAQARWPVRLMGDAIGAAAVLRQELGALRAEVDRARAGDPRPPLVRLREGIRGTPAEEPARKAIGVARRAKRRLAG